MELLGLVDEFLDPPGQVTHLSFEPAHAEFGTDRRAALTACHRRRRRAAIDLPLQHVEVALEAIEPLLRRAILAPARHRRGGYGEPQRDA